MRNIRRLAFYLYPLLVALLIPLILMKSARSGHIRKLRVTQDSPVTVKVALGRTTAISFSARPEKVVPGSPQALDINFLGKDLTLRPLDRNPGNLIIYTKSSRYVVILQSSSGSDYDDVVALSVSGTSLPLRLSEDSFRAVEIKLSEAGVRTDKKVTAFLRSNDRELSGAEFFDVLQAYPKLRCQGCLVRKRGDEPTLFCSRPVTKLTCQASGPRVIVLEREAP